MVTIAPERPGALPAIAQLVSAGVVAAVGHTDATYDETRAALEAGATAGTHLFNAMPPLHHRQPGPVAALLESSAYLELVADGVHVHPAVLALAWRTGRTALVTDAMAAAGAADGEYTLGSLSVVVRDGEARLASTGAIAASTATLASSLRYATSMAGVPLPDALAAVTSTPAAMLGLDGVGALAPVVRRPGRAVRRPRGEPRHAPRSLGPPILSAWLRTSWWWTTTTPTRGTWSISSRR